MAWSRGSWAMSVVQTTASAPTNAATFSNPFDEPARFIGTLTPDLYVDYFRDLSALPVGDDGRLNPADVGRTMAKYDTEVVG